MGSFAWNKADGMTNIENVASGTAFKFLIPKEFGGGFIKDTYQDYGKLGEKPNSSAKYDMYELIAFWNADKRIEKEIEEYPIGTKVRDILKYEGDEFPLMKEIDNHTDFNRRIGIHIGCYDEDIDKLEFPLKLVSVCYKKTYEQCESRSHNDPDQGFWERKRR